MFFADENVLFLVEDEVRAHGFRLIGFRLRFQSHGFGYGISPVLNIFSWWRLVPVRHTKPPRTPAGFPRYNFRTSTGNLFLMVETDPRPPPYNTELPREFCLAYWIGRSAPYKEQLQLKLLLAYWSGLEWGQGRGTRRHV